MNESTAPLAGQVVLVTGGGTGIGAAIADRFASEGAHVVVLGRRRDPLEAVADQVGGSAVVADATDSTAMRGAVETVVERHGRLDLLVANAGGHGYSSATDTDDAAWDAAIRTNLTSAFVSAREAMPALIAGRGRIVIISSLAGLFAGPSVAGYTVGKHALIGLTRTLARDYGRHGVRVNAVCPGWVRTPMADAEMDELGTRGGVDGRDAAYGLVTRHVPLGRPAEAREIASAVRFLGTDESSYITGAVLVVDGGAHVVDLPTIAFEDSGP